MGVARIAASRWRSESRAERRPGGGGGRGGRDCGVDTRVAGGGREGRDCGVDARVVVRRRGDGGGARLGDECVGIVRRMTTAITPTTTVSRAKITTAKIATRMKGRRSYVRSCAERSPIRP